ncbi:hypothetical protein C5167_012706, partial [Papaver somniferum]
MKSLEVFHTYALNRKRTSERYEFKFAGNDARAECDVLKDQISQLEGDRLSLRGWVSGLQIDNYDWRARSDHHCALSGQLARSLEVSNMLNLALLDENHTLSDANRGLKNNKLSFDNAYYRISRDRNFLENSIQFQKNISNDLSSELAKLSKEMDESCQSRDQALEDLRLFQSANHHSVISHDLRVVVSPEAKECLTKDLKERDSMSRQFSAFSRLVTEVSQERDDLRRDKKELEHSYLVLDQKYQYFADESERKYSKSSQRRVNEEPQLAVNWVCEKYNLPREVYPQVPVGDDEEEEVPVEKGGGANVVGEDVLNKKLDVDTSSHSSVT